MKSIPQRVKELPQLKLRASSGGSLAAAMSQLTDIQKAKLATLLAKPAPTEKQMEEITELIKKRDSTELSDGAKTFTREWLWEKMRQKRLELNNKALAKGLMVEDASIDIATRAYGWDFAMKNEKQWEDDFFTGTPDLKINVNNLDYIVDIKSSWDEKTFKLFDPAYNRDYMFQLQIYMHLTGIRNASLVYVLSDTPVHLIRAEAWSVCKMFGYDVPGGADGIEETEVYKTLLDKMTYNDLPDVMRVKKFDFHYDGFVIETLTQGVKACRTYKKQLVKEYFGLDIAA